MQPRPGFPYQQQQQPIQQPLQQPAIQNQPVMQQSGVATMQVNF